MSRALALVLIIITDTQFILPVLKRFSLVTFLLFAFLFSSSALNMSFRMGGSMLLYDKRYYPELWGEHSPIIPSANLKFAWQDKSDSRYADICHNPEYGIALGIDALGDAKAVNGPGCGNLYSLYGFVDRPWFRIKGFSLGYTAGWGFGFCFNKLFDQETNPWNEMISLPFMWHATLGLQGRYAIRDKHEIGIGLYFNHYSNGALYWINRGYNGFELALSYGIYDVVAPKTPAPGDVLEVKKVMKVEENEEDSTSESPLALRGVRDRALKPRLLAQYGENYRPGFQFDVQASGGAMTMQAVWEATKKQNGYGENYLRFKGSLQADCLYKYCRTQATGVGLDLFFTPFCKEISEAHKIYYDNDPNRNYDYKPVAVGLSVVHEFCYRNLTASVGVGYYLFDQDGISQSKTWWKNNLYQLVNFKYHFPKLADTYVGFVLKAHNFMAAESVQYCIGKRF